MKTAHNLLAALRAVAPSISIETIWEHDNDAKWDFDDETLDPDRFTAWQSEVRASAIVNGSLESGSDYLGGTWEKYGDNPAESNPDISGYSPQMIKGALEYLRKSLQANEMLTECDAAIYVCKKEMEERYAEQMAGK